MWLGSGVTVAVVWASAATLIRPLAWEPPYATGAALKKAKNKNPQIPLSCIPFSQILEIGMGIWGGHYCAYHSVFLGNVISLACRDTNPLSTILITFRPGLPGYLSDLDARDNCTHLVSDS